MMWMRSHPSSPEGPYNSISAVIAVIQTFLPLSALQTLKSLLAAMKEEWWKLLVMVCIKGCYLNSSFKKTHDSSGIVCKNCSGGC